MENPVSFLPDSEEPWTRRRWIRHFMVGSVAAFGASGWRGTLLAEISPGTSPTDILTVSLSHFPSLLDGSTPSIQLQLSASPEIIMINRAPFDGSIYVLNSRCTHMGCIVGKWNLNEKILCACHGSTFEIDGSLIYGAAGQNQPPLAPYNFSYDGSDLLKIEIPGLNLKITSVSVVSNTPSNKRLRLEFMGKEGCDYQVGYSTDLKTWTEPVLLSTIVDGDAEQTVVTAPANGPTEVWVDNSAGKGFYRIGLVLNDYP